jgi:hypothetical protein
MSDFLATVRGKSLLASLLPVQTSQITLEGLQFLSIRGAGIIVLYVAVLAALAAISGFVLGQRRSRWMAIAAGVALAFLSAFVLRRIELGSVFRQSPPSSQLIKPPISSVS